jgi:hypothetical protein
MVLRARRGDNGHDRWPTYLPSLQTTPVDGESKDFLFADCYYLHRIGYDVFDCEGFADWDSREFI